MPARRARCGRRDAPAVAPGGTDLGGPGYRPVIARPPHPRRFLPPAALALVVAACSADPQRAERTTSPVTTSVGASTVAAPSPAPAVAPTSTPATVRGEVDTKLLAAAWRNDVGEARRLIAAGADVNAKDETQQSTYLVATSEGYRELLELTLEHGADVRSLDNYQGTGLIRAAERGHTLVVGRLLRAGIDVDHVNRLGWTALHEAIVLGDGTQRYVDTVRVLVAGGADLALASARDGILPLAHAETRAQTDVARTLRAALTRPTRADPAQALLGAAASGDADGVAVAVRAGADLEARDDRARTALLLAATEDRVDVARLLVALGADPDALDAQHDSPWLVTGVTGSVAMAEVLLAAGPDLKLRNRFGGISIIPASERGHVDYVRRVVQTAIDVNHVNDLGWTALLEAVILGDGTARYQEIVRILLAAGADPSIADHGGVTALEHARSRGLREIVAILSGR